MALGPQDAFWSMTRLAFICSAINPSKKTSSLALNWHCSSRVECFRLSCLFFYRYFPVSQKCPNSVIATVLHQEAYLFVCTILLGRQFVPGQPWSFEDLSHGAYTQRTFILSINFNRGNNLVSCTQTTILIDILVIFLIQIMYDTKGGIDAGWKKKRTRNIKFMRQQRQAVQRQ